MASRCSKAWRSSSSSSAIAIAVLQVPPVRDRRRHQPGGRLRRARRLHHAGLRGDRRRCRDAGRRSEQHVPDRGRRRGHRDRVPTGPRAGRRFANRLVYGKRATPYEVLSEFAERMAGTYAVEDVLPRMARSWRRGRAPTRADVWLRVGDELRPGAVVAGRRATVRRSRCRGRRAPDVPTPDARSPSGTRASCSARSRSTKPPNEPLTPTEDKLLAGPRVAGGPGAAERRLTAELEELARPPRAARLVAAQDEERRKIERNLHDGAQQQLVALTVQARPARAAGGRTPRRRRQMSTQLQAGDAATRSTTCATSPAGSTRRCSPTRAWPRRSRRRPARPRCRRRSSPTGSAGTRRRSRRRSTSARSRRCRTSRSTRTRDGDGPARRAATDASRSRSSDDGRGFDADATTLRHGPAGHGGPSGRDRRHAAGDELPGAGTSVAGSVPVVDVSA